MWSFKVWKVRSCAKDLSPRAFAKTLEFFLGMFINYYIQRNKSTNAVKIV